MSFSPRPAVFVFLRQIEFIRDTYLTLRPHGISTEGFWETAQVAGSAGPRLPCTPSHSLALAAPPLDCAGCQTARAANPCSPLLRRQLLPHCPHCCSPLHSTPSFHPLVPISPRQAAYCLAALLRTTAAPLRSLLSKPLPPGGAASLGRDSQVPPTIGVMAQPILTSISCMSYSFTLDGFCKPPEHPPAPAHPQGRALGDPGSSSLRKLLWEHLLIWTEEAYILLRDIKARPPIP
jgi:hypothetical protein